MDTSPAVSTSSNITEPFAREFIATAAAGGSTPAAQENCEMHLLTTSATGDTTFGAGITGS